MWDCRKSFDALQSTNVRILRDEIVDLEGVQLVGIDYLTIGNPAKLDSIVAQINPAQPSVVLFHEPRFVEIMKKAGVSLQLAGHTHRGQIWPFNYISKRVYNGLDYGLYTDGLLQPLHFLRRRYLGTTATVGQSTGGGRDKGGVTKSPPSNL